MLTLMPSGPPEKIMDALLDVIRNPDLCKKHLDLLTAKKKEVDEAAAAAIAATTEARSAKAEADEAHAKAKTAYDAFHSDHATRTKALDERERLLLEKDARLTAYEAQVADSEQEHNQTHATRTHDLTMREASVAQREADLEKREAAASKLQETYERKAAKLKEAVG